MKFEEKDILVSSAILDSDTFEVYRMLNLSVRVNLEAQQDLLATNETSHEIMAEEFGKLMKEAYLKYCTISLPEGENKEKVKFAPLGKTHFVLEKAGEKEFGWYKLN